uniref:Uncharacterized protein n=1 Tax=viral metagenome TaxID=1070528 RepID=A0A6C0F5S6_9ZZZZ
MGILHEIDAKIQRCTDEIDNLRKFKEQLCLKQVTTHNLYYDLPSDCMCIVDFYVHKLNFQDCLDAIKSSKLYGYHINLATRLPSYLRSPRCFAYNLCYRDDCYMKVEYESKNSYWQNVYRTNTYIQSIRHHTNLNILRYIRFRKGLTSRDQINASHLRLIANGITNFNWILLNIEKHHELRLSRNIDGNTQTTIPIAWLCQWNIKTIKEYCKRENISGYSKINKSNRQISVRLFYGRDMNTPIGSTASIDNK